MSAKNLDGHSRRCYNGRIKTWGITMKINHKILSLPPYVSTSWKNVSMLTMDNDTLVIVLNNGTRIAVPELDKAIIQEIFAQHERVIELDAPLEKKEPEEKMFSFGLPFDLGGGNVGIENELGSFLQHNPELANSPDFPKEMLSKVADVSKRLGLDPDTSPLPKAEPHCNCPYCQIARALAETTDSSEPADEFEEEVSDEELTFREWDIVDLGENRYKVTNPLNTQEHYQVYLGEPIGCTCGMKNCEHIKAVLNS